MLDRIPSLISFFGVLILSTSVIYDLGFFFILGTNFSEMPTTLSDHLRSSLNWIHFAAISIFIYFFLDIFIYRVKQRTAEEEMGQLSSHLNSRAHKWPVYIYVSIVTIPIIKLLLGIDIHALEWPTYMLFVWLLINRYLFGHEKMRQQIPQVFRTAWYLFPAISMTYAFIGAMEAAYIRGGGGTQYVFNLEETKIVGTLARSFDKYFLVWDKNKEEIVLVSTSKVIQFNPQPEAGKSNSKKPTTAKE